MILIRVRPFQIFSLAIFLGFCTAAFAAHAQSQATQPQSSQTQATPAIPKIDGGIGACTANFTVHDGENKPIYDAQISVELRYGFWNKRKTDLQIGTDSNGKANFTGLPNFPKKPLEFHIKTGTVSKIVTDDPSAKCDATFDVVFSVR
jgi:hypothetical protein